MKIKRKAVLITVICALLLCSCSDTEDTSSSRSAEASAGHSIAESETTLRSSVAETVSSEGGSSSYFPEMLKGYVGRKSNEQTSDFDKMLCDAANLTKDDKEKFFEDFENFDDSKFSGFLKFSDIDNSGKGDGGIYQKCYLYGPYLLNLKGYKNVSLNEDTVKADGQLDISVCRPDNLYLSGMTYPYVQIRLIGKDGVDLQVESHTKEEIEKTAEIDLSYYEENPKKLPSPRQN